MHIHVAEEAPPLVDPSPQQMRASHIDPLTGEDEIADAPPAGGARFMQRPRDVQVDPNNPQTWGKVQRNAPCPCGSGRKFKHCHGALV
jgi:preprotein translocase subunit SecA